jgi:hypothetical protein
MNKLAQYVVLLMLLSLAGCQSMGPEDLSLIQNPGFEKGVGEQKFLGWDYEEHAGQWAGRAYEVASVAGAGPGNSDALRVTQIHDEHYSFLHQKIRVRPEDAGKKVRFSAILKTDNVGLVPMVSSGGILDAFVSTPVVGTSDWNNSFVIGVIPAGTTDVDVGFSLADSGTGWATLPKLVIE